MENSDSLKVTHNGGRRKMPTFGFICSTMVFCMPLKCSNETCREGGGGSLCPGRCVRVFHWLCLSCEAGDTDADANECVHSPHEHVLVRRCSVAAAAAGRTCVRAYFVRRAFFCMSATTRGDSFDLQDPDPFWPPCTPFQTLPHRCARWTPKTD